MPAPREITPEALHAAARRAGTRKAVGADGWAYGHLAAWPDALAIAWPSQSALVEVLGPDVVCLLPKKGSRSPSDRRPMTLMSALRRACAAIRAAQFRGWLHAEGVLPPAALASVEHGAAALVASIWDLTQALGRAAGLTRNVGKRVRFARTCPGRAALHALPGPPLAEAFLDLGVAQRAGPACGAPRRADLRVEVQERMRGLAQLALPWEARVRALAAAGVPAMRYGGGASPSGAADLRHDRRAVRDAPEALGCLTGLPWRADPAAVVAIVPWVAFGARRCRAA